MDNASSISYLFGLAVTEPMDFFVSKEKGDLEEIVGEMLCGAGLTQKWKVSDNITLYEDVMIEGVKYHGDTLLDFAKAVRNTKQAIKDGIYGYKRLRRTNSLE